MVETSALADLLTLAEQQFKPLSEAERALLRAAETGREAICGPLRDLDAPLNDPRNANSWGPERAIRASLLKWLCVGGETPRLVHHLGISVFAARFDERLDLSFVTLSFPLSFKACWWPDGIALRNAVVPEFGLTKCLVGGVENAEVPALDASRVKIVGTVSLNDGFQAEGEVRLLQAEIGGLSCAGGEFKNALGPALNANGANISGAVHLRDGFRAKGEVQLLSAKIGGNLNCEGGSFKNPKGSALNAERAKIGGAALLRKNPRTSVETPSFEAEGEVRFFGAEIAVGLECTGSSFKNPEGFALNASGAKIGGAALLNRGFQAEGEVIFYGVQVGGNLSCEGGSFTNSAGPALNAEAAKIGGAVLLRRNPGAPAFEAGGEVRLFGAEIGRNLDCEGGSFKNSSGPALNAEAAKIGGAALLRKNPRASAETPLFEAEGEVRFFGAEIAANLECIGGSFKNPKGFALNTAGANIGGAALLDRGFHAEGEVIFYGAQVGGNLSCEGGSFTNSAGPALNAEAAKIGGAVLLRRNPGAPAFEAEGEVRLFGAEIGRNLDCEGGSFKNPKGFALNAEAARIGGAAFLRKNLRASALAPSFEAEGEVRFFGAEIAAALDCSGGTFKNPRGFALNANGVKIGGTAFLQNGFHAEGEVVLFGGQVGGRFSCEGGSFKSQIGPALNAEGAKIGGAALLRKNPKASVEAPSFEAEGEVRFFGAEIGRDLDCDSGAFKNPRGLALNVAAARIGGAALLRQNPFAGARAPAFEADGEVSFFGAEIGRNLECVGGSFKNSPACALNLEDATIRGSVLLGNDFRAHGWVQLRRTAIGGDFNIVGSKILDDTKMNLSGASCAVLIDVNENGDASESWPSDKKLMLDGFVYRRMSIPGRAEHRLKWLRQQLPTQVGHRRGGFRPQPYKHLAGVLRSQGQDAEAKAVLIGMAIDRRKWGGLGLPSRVWHWILWATIGNGYQPVRAGLSFFVLWLVGAIVFSVAFDVGAMAPSEKKARDEFLRDQPGLKNYEPFIPILYAIDSSLPIINFGQKDKWQPFFATNLSEAAKPDTQSRSPTAACGPGHTSECVKEPSASNWLIPWLNWFRAIYIALGWILTTMFVAGVSGLVARD
jgi:hypothetical protein